MKRVLSWIVLLLISCLISLLSSFVGMIRSYIFSFINELSTFLRVLIYVFGGTTFFSLLLLPVHYGSLLAISASEAIKNSKRGMRYVVFSVLMLITNAIYIIIGFTKSTFYINAVIMCIYYVMLIILGREIAFENADDTERKETNDKNIKMTEKPKRNFKTTCKILCILILYIAAIIIQINNFTPYTTTQTYISSQNVPHVIVVERGYANINNINHKYTDKKGTVTKSQINFPLAALQFLLTTAAAALAYYMLVRKKQKYENKLAAELKSVSEQNLQLKNTINTLKEENSKSLNTKKLYEIIPTDNNFSENTQTYDNIPLLDVNALAFADEETVRAAQANYAKEMYNYIKNNSSFDETRTETKEMIEGEQLSISDTPPVKLPYWDAEALASASEEVRKEAEAQYIENLCEYFKYVKNKVNKEK